MPTAPKTSPGKPAAKKTSSNKTAAPAQKATANEKKAQKALAKKMDAPIDVVNNDGIARQLLGVNTLLFGAIFFVAAAIFAASIYLAQSKVEILGVTEDGRLFKPMPLNKAFVTESRVISVTDECLRRSFSHDFENYRATMNDAKPCYTSAGAKSIETAIDPILEDMKQKRVVMSVTTQPPIVSRGPFLRNGRVTWEMEAVITIYFQGARENFAPQMREVTATVVRVPPEENARGVAIESIQLAPYRR